MKVYIVVKIVKDYIEKERLLPSILCDKQSTWNMSLTYLIFFMQLTLAFVPT